MQRARSEFGAGEKNTNEPIMSSNSRRISKIERFEYTFLTQTVSLHDFYFQAQSLIKLKMQKKLEKLIFCATARVALKGQILGNDS